MAIIYKTEGSLNLFYKQGLPDLYMVALKITEDTMKFLGYVWHYHQKKTMLNKK